MYPWVDARVNGFRPEGLPPVAHLPRGGRRFVPAAVVQSERSSRSSSGYAQAYSAPGGNADSTRQGISQVPAAAQRA